MARFADIIDQEQIVKHMQNALTTGKLSHAYIISGEAHSGKRMLADAFAQAILCEDRKEKDGYIESCGECHSCKQAMSGSHPDIRVIRHEKAATISVNNIREQLCNDVFIKPYSDHKIYIVPDGELMNASAQNALLKTLEEPPSYTTIIILTSNIDAFLPTIISRCIVFPIKPVRDDLIMKFLMEKKQIVDYKARLAVSFAQGNIGKAIMLTENEDFERLKEASLDLINKMDRLQINEAADRLQAILAGAETTDNDTPESGDEESKGGKTAKKADLSVIDNFLDVLMFFIRDVLVFKAEESADHLIFADKLSYISSVTKKYTYSELNNILKAIDEARSRIKSNVNSLLTLEMLLLKIRDSKENL